MNKWKVMKRQAGGEYYWQVYRIRNTGEADHTGNREIVDTLFYSAEKAHKKADEMNGYGREDKAEIAKSFGETLKKTREYEDIESMTYEKQSNGEKFVIMTFKNGAQKQVYVTGDSGIALIRDVDAALRLNEWKESR